MVLLISLAMYLLVAVSWAAMVFILAWLLRRLFKFPDTLFADTILLFAVFLANAFSIFDPDQTTTYDITVLVSTFHYLIPAFLLILWVHKASD